MLLLTEELKKFQNISVNIVSLPLKIKKFTVLKSPHVDKKDRDQFELRTYIKLIHILLDTTIKTRKDDLSSLFRMFSYVKSIAIGMEISIKINK